MVNEALNTEVSNEELPAADVITPDEGVETPAEKTVLVSRVEELIKKAKLKGQDRGRSEMQDELDRIKLENETLRNQGGTENASQGTTGPNQDEMTQQVYSDVMANLEQHKQAIQHEQLQAEYKKMAEDFHSKMQAGKDQFDDFDKVMSDFDLEDHPQLVYLANQLDNTPAVLYELNKNPGKLAEVAYLAERHPKLARAAINKLSGSIKANESAKSQEKNVNAPLNRMKSSQAGQDNGGTEIRDFRQKYRG